MNKNKILQLLKNDEGFKLDFKLKLSLELDSEKKEFVKDVIAIANTPGGRGYIIFGVEDATRRIVGLNDIPEHVEERFQLIIANRATPPVPVRFDTITIEEKVLGVVTIFKSMQVPHQMLQTGAFYIRRGSTTDKAGRHEIANMLQQYGMLSFENVPCRGSSLKDLDEKALSVKWSNHKGGNEEQLLILSSLGIIATDYEKEVYYPTYGGLLLFGKHPQDFIPQAIVEVSCNNRVVGIEGNILEMLKAFEEYVTPLLPKTYPISGLVEVLTNALIHRNYWNNAQYIQVILDKDYVQVTNPMSHEVYEGKRQRARVNPWLYSRLLIMSQRQDNFHLGIGLEKTKELFKEVGEVRIETKRLEGVFEVSLPGTASYQKEGE